MRMAAMVVLIAGAPLTAPRSNPPASGLSSSIAAPATAEQALARYRGMVGALPPSAAACAKQHGEEIVVCARRRQADQRLPLPDERFAPGEVVRRSVEAPPATNAFRGGPQEPSKLMETIFKGAGLIKGAISGEDPEFVPPR